MRFLLITIISIFLPFSSMSAQDSYESHIYGGTDGGVVGAIEDEISVTPGGQLSYNVPIKVPSGTGGMAPTLSIAYSNTNRDGLCGYNFDLTGISYITRCPQDLYHDDTASSVTFSSSDCFSLDGVRLMRIATTDGGAEYRLENDPSCKVMAYGSTDNPTSFIVYTKDGLIYEYTPDTSIYAISHSEKALLWAVTKVSDTVGNYYTVAYNSNKADNEIWPVRIDYTGNSNAGLAPYASVRFLYLTNNYGTSATDCSIAYVHGRRIRRNRRLASINLYNGEKMVRRYVLSYNRAVNRNTLFEIAEYAGDGTHKNPTKITWTASESHEQLSTVSDNIGISVSDDNPKATGDFNGDGIQDIVVAGPFRILTSDLIIKVKEWKVIYGSREGFKATLEGDNYNESTEKIVVGDYNGDGLDDIIIKYNYNGFHNCCLFTSSFQDGVHVFVKQKVIYSDKTDYDLQTVEINGDGVADLFVWQKDSRNFYTWKSLYKDGVLTPLGVKGIGYSTTNFGNVSFLDFNGDGLTDVINMTDEGHELIRCVSSEWMTSEKKGGIPTESHYAHFGDFNGDGKTDILVTGSSKNETGNEWPNWIFDMSDGTGNFVRTYAARLFDTANICIFVADINSDGLDDIIGISPSDAAQHPKIYLNNGLSFTKSEDASAATFLRYKHVFFGDFNGDGKSDMLSILSTNTGGYRNFSILSFPEDNRLLLTDITDGMGNTTSIDYSSVADTTAVLWQDKYTYPLASPVFPCTVVTRISSVSAVGSTTGTSYTYTNPIVHKRGRGFLGFSRVNSEDLLTGIVSQTDYAVQPETQLLYSTYTTTSLNGKTLTEENIAYVCDSQYDGKVKVCLPSNSVKNTYEYNTGILLSGTHTTYHYDDFGNLTHSEASGGGTVVETSNTYTNDTEQWLLGRLTSSIVTTTNSEGCVTRHSSFTYDPETGLLLTECAEPDNPLGYVKTYVRDQYGNITESTTKPNDTSIEERTVRTTYDSTGRFLLSTADALGNTTTSAIDPDLGVQTTNTDPNGFTIEYTHDGFGNAAGSSSPLAEAHTVTGWASGVSDAPVGASYFTYTTSTATPFQLEFFDREGRALRKVTESYDHKKIFSDFVYDEKGRLKKNSEPYYSGETTYWTEYEYDDVGRIIRRKMPAGGIFSIGYNGLTITETDPLGHSQSKQADGNGNLVVSTDNAGNKVTYTYGPQGKPVRIESPRTIVEMEYDIFGNRIRLDDPDMGIETTEYDSFGNVVSSTDSKGTTTYTYDKLGRVICESTPDGIITTTYDTKWIGAVSVRESLLGGMLRRDEYNYSVNGQLTSVTTRIGDKSTTTSYTYNSQNQLDRLTYPTGFRVRYEYSTNGILTDLYDDATGQRLWHLTSHDSRGQVTGETYGNGSHTSITRNKSDGLITSISTPNIHQWSYTYDLVGNMTSRKNIKSGLQESFEYDNMYRLIRVAKGNSITQQLTYDEAGNILSKSDVAGRYEYEDGTNRLIRLHKTKYTPVIWDDIRYNSFNKITFIRHGEDSLRLYYGADQSRCMSLKTIGGTTRRKMYFSSLYEEEQVLASGEWTKTCYVKIGGRTVAILTTQGGTSEMRYVHVDPLGSAQAFSDTSGTLVQELSYDAWGRRRNPATWQYYEFIDDAAAWNDRGFTGHEHIDVFELVNMDGRMYDPVLGRFLSPDPIVQAGDYTQSYNRYAYCLNNPLTLIDPTGYSWLSKNWKTITAAAVGITVSVVTAGSGTGIGIAIVAGAAGGAASALTGALLNGANFDHTMEATFRGAFWGAVSAAANNYIGDIEQVWLRIGAHALSEGALEGLQGGNMLHGFIIGAVSSAGNYAINKFGSDIGKVGKIVSSAVLGGTVAEIGGGKFANGAITAAYSMMFNDLMHPKKNTWRTQRDIERIEQEKIDIQSDGILEFGEAVRWWQDCDGAPICVDASKLDLSFLNKDIIMGMNVGDQFPIYTFDGNYKQAVVYGKLTGVYQGNGYISIRSDLYDFNIETWRKGNFWRNVGTIYSKWVNGHGTPFWIHFKGQYKLK